MTELIEFIESSPYQEFELVLRSNPQNGYLWYPPDLKDDDIIILLKEIKEPLPKYTGCKQHFFFRSIKQGEKTFEFIYRRSWEEDAYQKKMYKIVIS